MPSGLQVFDGQGQTTLDTSSYAGRILGSVYIGAQPGSGQLSNAGLTTGWAFAIPQLDLTTSIGPVDFNLFWTAPTVWFSGDTMFWFRPGAMAGRGGQYPHCTLWYGVR